MPEVPELATLDARQRRNALFIVAAQTSSKLGDVLCDAKTVLTWLMGVIGAPPAMTALLVPIRESGSMLPQAFISGLVKRGRRRKWIYAAGAAGQAACLAAMGAGALLLDATWAGVAVLGLLALYALARCLCSIASKDVLGKTVPRGTRGRITGAAASISGFLGLAAALAVIFSVEREAPQALYGWLLLAGSSLYLVTAGAISAVAEQPSDEVGGDLLEDFVSRGRLVLTDPTLRKFVIARTLLLGSALASPYLVMLSQQQGFDLKSLAAFVLAGGLASALSSMLWGRLSDRSSRHAMALGGGIAGVIGLTGVAVAAWMPAVAKNLWTWPALFFLMSLGYAGVRIGRKTYVVDASEGGKRTDYVSASNTLIAIMILVLGAAGSALQSVHASAALAFFSTLCLIGTAYLPTLRDASE